MYLFFQCLNIITRANILNGNKCNIFSAEVHFEQKHFCSLCFLSWMLTWMGPRPRCKQLPYRVLQLELQLAFEDISHTIYSRLCTGEDAREIAKTMHDINQYSMWIRAKHGRCITLNAVAMRFVFLVLNLPGTLSSPILFYNDSYFTMVSLLRRKLTTVMLITQQETTYLLGK